MRYRYTWLRCTMDGSRCAKLGKNGQSYVVGAADGDYTIRVAVTATNAAGSRTALSRATEPVPGGYSIEPADALVLYSFAVTPAPRSGGTLVANLRVVHVDGTPVLGAAVRCNAAAGTRKLAQSGRLFSNGFARCTWRVPALAAGARIAGALTVVVSGQAARRSFTVYVA